ncbi:lytic transglycosylase domain-containing protein [uncultured Sphingosinicella sp.]|uniref:lytic transglycosylase domain-containing protein n=1 Tax=uncultured Sphingosinicella sp. TaxID=478748 RepID=UPI0030D729F0|tara:strand:- start:17793 stop:18593 length:801 start_codon:yes stop_codon:yes gene_type:complete
MNPTPLSTIAGGADRVRTAIAEASRRTGVDFDYLYNQAKVESGLRPDAKARTSSATGLYQFIDQSWLGALKRHGAEHGLGWAAGAIKTDARGRLTIADAGLRPAIMNLRNEPEASALMAAETARENQNVIEGATGRTANATDLYMGHFLGPRGASKFLGAMAANPDQRADQVMPAAAAANRAVFYASNGTPRSLSEVYERFAAKMGNDAPDRALAARAPAMPAEPPLPMSLALALAGEDAAALDGLLTTTKPEAARLAYLTLASLG